jgi:Pyruvate/2-oxoacid:ferredoxin oxidoreductase delta subunit
MERRKIIRIDETLCNGCGDCIVACAEGALRLVDGKARLVKETYCDGFGDCVGECPTGALVIEEREAAPFDLDATREHVAETGGPDALQRLGSAAARHERPGPVTLPLVGGSSRPGAAGGGCPGSRARVFDDPAVRPEPIGGGGPGQAIPSELRQWPVQLHLVQPGMPIFRDRELVVMNPCGPVASADVHWRFLRGRSVVMACPKLDDTRPYASKLAAILADRSIPRVTVVRMEVPCCGGLTAVTRQAVELSGRTDLALEVATLGVDGTLRRTAD